MRNIIKYGLGIFLIAGAIRKVPYIISVFSGNLPGGDFEQGEAVGEAITYIFFLFIGIGFIISAFLSDQGDSKENNKKIDQ